jgi:hypothetical protein
MKPEGAGGSPVGIGPVGASPDGKPDGAPDGGGPELYRISI